MARINTRKALITIGIDARGFETDAQKLRKKLAALVKGAPGKLGGAASSFVGNLASDAVGKVVGFVSDMGNEVIDAERKMTRLAIAGGMSAKKMDEFRQAAGKASTATGIARNELIDGAQAYLSLTGDAEGTTSAMETFADVAIASGASMTDIATAAAALKDNLQIDPSQFKTAFDVLITQGKAGAIEIKDLASELSTVAPQFSKFRGAASAQGLAELGATFQVVRKAFGSASMATTGIGELFTAIDRNAKKLKASKYKIKVYDDQGQKRSFSDVMGQLSKIKSDTEVINLLGSAGAARTLAAYRDYAEVREKILRDSQDSNATDKDKARYMASVAGKIDLAMAAAKNSLVEAFTPERIEKFVKALQIATEWFVSTVEWFSDFMDENKKRGAEQEYQEIIWKEGVLPELLEDDTARRQVELAQGLKPGSLGNAVKEGRQKFEADVWEETGVILNAMERIATPQERVLNETRRALGQHTGAFGEALDAVEKARQGVAGELPFSPWNSAGGGRTGAWGEEWLIVNNSNNATADQSDKAKIHRTRTRRH